LFAGANMDGVVPGGPAINPGAPPPRPSPWLVVLPLVLLALVGLLAPLFGDVRQITFLIALALLILEFGLIGRALRNRWIGILVDSRNVMSLSRLQMCGWTLLVLSALLVGAAFNVPLHTPVDVGVSTPPELIAAMGISAASLAASPALLSLKTGQTPTDTTLQTQSRSGAVATNVTIQDASWTDMITGDEVGNAATADLGKIQQLLVTLLLLGIYGVMVWYAFAGKDFVPNLPVLDQKFIWLLGVSHASYLAYKAAPHTATTPTDNGP